MFLGTRKSVSTLHFPFGNPMLPFEVREAVCLLEMSPFVPCLDSMSNGYIRVFGPCVPSFTLYAHACSPPCGLKLHSFPCSWLSHITLCIRPLSSVPVHVDVPSWVFSECSVLEEAPKACVSLSGHGLLESFE